MLEVVEHHPHLYLHAAGTAKSNPAVMITAFARCLDLTANTVKELHFQGKDDVIHQLLASIRRTLLPFESFSSRILANMVSTQSDEYTGTSLTLFNQGLETSIKYKKLLAEYLDIPTGKWLRRLQLAEKHVVQAIAPWTTSDED
mmetsp:Transcript_526/g.982  ORF Transcript_526/g.982 Transcript_526/m.982 type:complete len:144 (-) Transcript_526:92-523(-)